MATAAASVRPPGRLRRAVASDHVAGWLFVLPSVLLIVLFGLIPIVWGFVLSLQKAGLISPSRPFVGLANYEHDRERPAGAQAAVNAAYYTFLFVPISIVLALFLAIALNRKIRLIRFYRLAVFIPVARLDDRHRDHVPVAVRQGVRPGELPARQGRAGAVRLLRLAAAARCPRSW